MCNSLWWLKLFRHWKKLLHHITRSVISNSCYSKVSAILVGQSLHRSCGPPGSQMASEFARPNWMASPVGLDITGVWLFNLQYCPGKDHGNADALSRRVYTMSQQLMFPQISTEELCKTQSRDDKLQPLIQYLKDGTLPNDAQKKVNTSSVAMTFYTNNLMQEKKTVI